MYCEKKTCACGISRSSLNSCIMVIRVSCVNVKVKGTSVFPDI